MRISETERDIIVKVISKHDPNSKIYLFGSRADDSKKGGDIDLLIISDNLSLEHKIKIQVELEVPLDEQKVDITIRKEGDIKDVFTSSIIKNAIILTL